MVLLPNFSKNVFGWREINILIVGEPGSGKSTILHRFVTDNFDKPLSEKDISEIKSYKHGEVYHRVSNASIALAEMDFENDLTPECVDYLYQNANIIIHVSDIGEKEPPTKKEILEWYNEFVKTIFRGQQVENPQLVEKIFNKLQKESKYLCPEGVPSFVNEDESTRLLHFEANPENRNFCRLWFCDLQLAKKIGYVIFVFNKLDKRKGGNIQSGCGELFRCVSTLPSSRSILQFDAISAADETIDMHTTKSIKVLETLNDWATRGGLPDLSAFHQFDPDRLLDYKKKSQGREVGSAGRPMNLLTSSKDYSRRSTMSSSKATKTVNPAGWSGGRLNQTCSVHSRTSSSFAGPTRNGNETASPSTTLLRGNTLSTKNVMLRSPESDSMSSTNSSARNSGIIKCVLCSGGLALICLAIFGLFHIVSHQQGSLDQENYV